MSSIIRSIIIVASLILPTASYAQQAVKPVGSNSVQLTPNAFTSADNVAAQVATFMHGGLMAWDSAGSNWDRVIVTSGALNVLLQNSTLAVTQSGAWSVTLNTGANTIGAVNQAGTWTVQPGNTANTTPWLFSLSQTGTNNDVDAAISNFPTTASTSAISIRCVNTAGNAFEACGGGGGGGGTSSSYGAAFPATGTAIGLSDGTNMQPGRAIDTDTGAGTVYAQGVTILKRANGGPVEFGTSTDPIRIDPTGTTTQPVSGTLTVTQGTGTNLHIVCDSGCSSSAGFADNGAFTFGTTAVNPIAGVLDDVSTNTATENSASVARITAQKALHSNLRNASGTEIGVSGAPLRIDPTGTTTQPISVASLPLPTGASTLAEQQTQTTALQLIDNLPLAQGAATAGQNGVLAQGAVTTASPTYTNGNTNPLSLQTDGSLRTAVTNIPAVSQSGTWTVQPGNTANTTPWLFNFGQYGGANVGAGNAVHIQPGTGASFATVEQSSSAILAGQQAVTATAAALASNTTKEVCLKALLSNTISVYVGPSGVTTSTGLELGPGDSFCTRVTNTNALFVIASGVGPSVSWSARN